MLLKKMQKSVKANVFCYNEKPTWNIILLHQNVLKLDVVFLM